MIPWEQLTDLSELTCPQGGWKPTAVATTVEAILARGTRRAERTRLGESFEGRPIDLLTIGDGPKRALMWSQMHGDEPTHTTMLLNLLGLLTSGEEALVGDLLAGLTIGMIMPLNPDGAQRNTRHNGQGIDVNRDALRFATNEGQAMRTALERFRPDYGFNLHNQSHLTAIGPPSVPAAVSLLVPPIDPDDTQNDVTTEATRVAAYFCERVRGHCDGRVSRYEVDYMARAFGEWWQRQGVSTILIEASGWPGGDLQVLEKLHFAAFVPTLQAMAADALGKPGGLGDADPRSYLDLPKSSDHRLFDLLVKPACVAYKASGDSPTQRVTAEVGVDFPGRKAGCPEPSGGVIVAIGDLHENGGVDLLEATGQALAPGRIVLAETAPDAFDDAAADWDALSASGVTTALAPVDLSAPGVEETLTRTLADPPPINAVLVGYWSAPPTHEGSFYEQLTAAVAAGLAAVIGPLPSPGLEAACERIGVPVLEPETIPRIDGPLPETLDAWLDETARVADRLGWTDRGRIGLNAAADFVLLNGHDGPLSADCLQAVCVGGTVVRDTAGPTSHLPGRWLHGDR